jgi:hypothetical protein
MTAAYERPSQCWARLDALKQPVLRKCERYAALTIAKLCLPSGHNPAATSQSMDYQSLGAAAVNHLNNRILLTLFRPGDPFFRLDPGKRTEQELRQLNMTKEDLAEALAIKELEAVSVLDQRAIRPKLYQAGRHIIVCGNVVMELGEDENVRTYGIKNFCVKRTATGKLHTLALNERVKFDELEPEVRDLVPGKVAESEVNFIRVIKLQDDGSYKMEAAVDDIVLPEKFGGKWPEEKLPFRVLTWDLADEHDYATGLVEEFEGDFEALSALSESLLDGSILTTEMRWLVNPGGVTSVEDFRKSRNGDAIAGQKGDVEAVSGGDAKAIEQAIAVIEVYNQRIARGFLLQSAMVRNAERVTAEEIRAIALELETAFGGVYSQLGLAWQKPVAHWCLRDIGMDIRGTDIKVTVITGLEALSRNAKLEKLRAALADLAEFEQLPEGLKARMNWSAVAKFVGQGRGVDLGPFLKTEEQVREEQEQAMSDQATTAAGVAAGEQAAIAGANQGAMTQ